MPQDIPIYNAESVSTFRPCEECGDYVIKLWKRANPQGRGCLLLCRRCADRADIREAHSSEDHE